MMTFARALAVRPPLLRLLVALLATFTLTAPALAANRPLTLSEAWRLTQANNPALASWRWRLDAGRAKQQQAALGAAYTLSLDAENLAGDHAAAGIDQAELTLSLGSVFALGNQRDARRTLASAELSQLQLQQQSAQLALLAELTQRYVTALAAQQTQQLATEACALAQRSLAQVEQRLKRGAASDVSLWQAKAALIQAQLAQQSANARLSSDKQALASLWQADANTPMAPPESLAGELTQLPTLPDFASLLARAQQAPYAQALAQAQRVEAARVDWVKSQSSAAIDWQLGVRHQVESHTNSAQLGVSIPLASRKRNQHQLLAAERSTQALAQTQKSALNELRLQLYRDWQTQQNAAAIAHTLEQQLIPALTQALTLSRKALAKGSLPYRDLALAQQQLLDAKQQWLDAALAARLAQTRIEASTGLALSSFAAHATRSQTP